MHEELKKLVAASRKQARDLKELRDLRIKINSHKAPDPKMLKMVDDEITRFVEQK